MMNTNFKIGGEFHDPDKVLELTSKGYSTREAKRKIERDNKKKFNKMRRLFN